MIYDETNSWPWVETGPRIKRVTDANGLDWTRTLSIDTNTGEIIRFKSPSEIAGLEAGECIKETIKVPLPLHIEFYEEAPIT